MIGGLPFGRCSNRWASRVRGESGCLRVGVTKHLLAYPPGRRLRSEDGSADERLVVPPIQTPRQPHRPHTRTMASPASLGRPATVCVTDCLNGRMLNATARGQRRTHRSSSKTFAK